jgi:peroxiredoxin
LADFQQHLGEFEALGARIVFLSSDTGPDATATVDRLGLRFPVAYGLDPEAVSRLIGCYTGRREGRPHVQPAAFVLARDGAIVHAMYSSDKVGRLTSADTLTLLRDELAKV